MIIRLGQYRANNTEFLKYYYEKRNHDNLPKLIAELAASIHVPCIVLSIFLLEMIGSNKELEADIESLKLQYSIKEITE